MSRLFPFAARPLQIGNAHTKQLRSLSIKHTHPAHQQCCMRWVHFIFGTIHPAAAECAKRRKSWSALSRARQIYIYVLKKLDIGCRRRRSSAGARGATNAKSRPRAADELRAAVAGGGYKIYLCTLSLSPLPSSQSRRDGFNTCGCRSIRRSQPSCKTAGTWATKLGPTLNSCARAGQPTTAPLRTTSTYMRVNQRG